MRREYEEDTLKNPVGEVAVSVLCWIIVLLSFGALLHKLFF